MHDLEGGFLIHVHCMKLRKCAQLPPNQLVAILQANIHYHDLVVSLCPSRHDPSRHHHCHLQLIGAHETRPHPFQHFAYLHEVAIADVPANESAIKFPHSKYCTVTKVQIIAPESIEDFLRGDSTNWFTDIIEWAIWTKTLGNKLVSQWSSQQGKKNSQN